MVSGSALFVPIAAAVTGLRLFAEATPSIDPGLSTLLGNAGVIGVLVWYLWYDTTKSRPLMLEKFTKEQEELRQLFSDEQENSRNTFTAEQRAMRESHERETAKLRDMLIESLKAMRTAVHDNRDIANQVVLQTELAAQRAIEGTKPK